jgi:sortase A
LDAQRTQGTGDAGKQAEAVVAVGARHLDRKNVLPAGTVLSHFEIPRLGMKWVLLEGTDAKTLDKSIGHVEGTAMPGESGNIAIAGHRNTHFRKLEWIRRGDEIILKNASGEYRYVVEWGKLFTPDDIEVLDAQHGPAVTLVTCFPFEYVGAAPLRYIVRALPK